jgi:oligosaccharide repeat unit polymerase
MILSILATFVLLALGAVAKLLTRDWFHPAPLFCMLWASVCGVAIAVAPENITSASGPLWILLNAALVVAGGVAGTAFACSTHHRRLALKTSNDRTSQPFSQVALRRATALCIALGFAYVVLLLHAQGIGVGQLLNLRGLAAAAMKMSFSRYSKASQGAGIYLQLLLCISYLAPLLGGTLFVLRKRRLDKALALLSLLPSLLAFSTQSTRSSVIYGACMWAAGFLSTRSFQRRRAQRISRRAIVWVAFGIPAGLLLISIGDVLRGGGQGAGSIGEHLLSARTKTYMCGHLAALSQWMDTTDLGQIQPAFGQYGFAGAFEALHPGTRVGGIFAESEFLPTGPSNVYTYFRALIQDVTVPGSLFVMFALALCGGYAYRRVFDRATSWIGILAACYGGSLLFITSIFNYNSMILAFVLYGVSWSASRRQRRIMTWAR